jgi:hypothetical protein
LSKIDVQEKNQSDQLIILPQRNIMSNRMGSTGSDKTYTEMVLFIETTVVRY